MSKKCAKSDRTPARWVVVTSLATTGGLVRQGAAQGGARVRQVGGEARLWWSILPRGLHQVEPGHNGKQGESRRVKAREARQVGNGTGRTSADGWGRAGQTRQDKRAKVSIVYLTYPPACSRHSPALLGYGSITKSWVEPWDRLLCGCGNVGFDANGQQSTQVGQQPAQKAFYYTIRSSPIRSLPRATSPLPLRRAATQRSAQSPADRVGPNQACGTAKCIGYGCKH